MKTNGHTKGPWVVFDADQSIGTVESTTGQAIAQAAIIGPLRGQNKETVAERKANARLIAAAPDLLSEMQRYLPILERLHENVADWIPYAAGTGIATLNGYKAALAKAAGTNKIE